MATDPRPVRDKTKREFLPTDPKDDEDSFGSANGWGRKQLKMLGVTFSPNAKKRLDLRRIVDVTAKWSPEIQRRIMPILSVS